jgi:hypothetical protein
MGGRSNEKVWAQTRYWNHIHKQLNYTNLNCFRIRTSITNLLRSDTVCCATRRKVAGSIPDCVIVIFPSRPYYGARVDSASNRNEYQKYS